MAANTVCISRFLGAGGEEIGRAVAERLGFRYVDDQIISRVAERSNVTPEIAAKAEERQSIVSRVIDALSGGSSMHFDDQSIPVASAADYQELIRDVVVETGNKGQAVIVAHAASHAFPDAPGVLRVLITASEDAQVRRLVDGGSAQSEATDAARESQRARADYLKRFYGVDSERPEQYDVVLNTDSVDVTRAVDLIVELAQ